MGFTLFSGVSLLLSAVNLIPAAPLDGGRMLAAIFAKAGLPNAPLFVIHCAASLGLLLLGLYIFNVTNGNFTCILLAVWLLFSGVKSY
jgi:membrane-associated protease RseP (regulator of RpoE activity)